MLLRRVSNVNGFELQAVTLQVDPHGQLLCLFNPDRLEFVLFEVAEIFKHFFEYRYKQINLVFGIFSTPPMIIQRLFLVP
mgnify:FL=1